MSPSDATASSPALAASRATLGRVLDTFEPYRRPVTVAISSAAAAAAAGVVPALIVRRILDRAIPAGSSQQIVALAVAIVIFASLAAMLAVAHAYVTGVVGQRIVYDLRNSVYSSVRRQSVHFFGDARAADLAGFLTSGVDGAAEAVTSAAAISASFFTAAATLLAMTMLSGWLTLAALVLVPVMILPVRRLHRIEVEAAARREQRLAGLSELAREALGAPGATLAKVFGRDEHEGRRFAERTRAIRDAAIRDAVAGRWMSVARQAAWAAAPAAVWLVGGRRVVAGSLSVGSIVAFTILQARLVTPLERLLSARSDATATLARFARIFEQIDLVPDVEEKPGATRLAAVQGRFAFDRVTLSSRGAASLYDVSFEVPAGRTLAVLGSARSGATAIAPLASRLHDPDSGSVLLDGHDLRDLALASIAGAVSTLGRDAYLFHASVRENILYGRPDASEADIAEAAKAARVHDVALALPDGYDTIVGDHGHRLTPGEALRIAYARAILMNPAVVVVDEGTHVADPFEERFVQRALAALLKGRTAIVLAHRAATVVAADRILVLDGGRVAEHGPHSELLAREGLYARLYREQLSGGPRLADVLA